MDSLILVPQLNQTEKIGDTYLRFQLDSQTPAILSVECVQEVLIVPSRRITSIPNMPKCVLGLLNRRNRVLWVIDLAQMLNLEPINTNAQQYNLVIIRVGHIPLGLVVQEFQGVTRFTLDCIQSVQGLISSSLNPYLRGCILQKKEILLVLNAEGIVHSHILHSN